LRSAVYNVWREAPQAQGTVISLLVFEHRRVVPTAIEDIDDFDCFAIEQIKDYCTSFEGYDTDAFAEIGTPSAALGTLPMLSQRSKILSVKLLAVPKLPLAFRT
jgi:hypothetical protein